MPSSAAYLASLEKTERERILRGLSSAELEGLTYDWKFWARPSQLPPDGDWFTWLILAGRGWGKTKTGAEYVRMRANNPNERIAIVGATAADARDVMVEGESGILACCPPNDRPLYEPSKRRLTWPNGAMATTYSADEPDRLRGPQHHSGWADEIGAWNYPDAWDMLMMGMRLGNDNRIVVTTTPRPIPILRDLIKDQRTAVTRGSTYDNAANLGKAFLQQIESKYEGTRLGRQELYAEILDDAEGALWTRGMIDGLRV